MAYSEGGGAGNKKKRPTSRKVRPTKPEPRVRSTSARKRTPTQTGTNVRSNSTSVTATGTKNRKGPAPRKQKASSQAASQVGINAYRDYANSMTNLAQTGIRPVANPYRYQGPNLNPFDALGAGLRGVGEGVRDAFGNLVPQDILFRRISERIRNPRGR